MPEEPAFASVDVSFISLRLILPAVAGLLREGGQAVCLVKPQFEAGREKVGKKGVVREPEIHGEVIRKIIDYADMVGFGPLHLDYSPVRGPEGNIEYLLHLKKEEEPSAELRGLSERDAEERLREVVESGGGLSRQPGWESLIGETVAASHAQL